MNVAFPVSQQQVKKIIFYKEMKSGLFRRYNLITISSHSILLLNIGLKAGLVIIVIQELNNLNMELIFPLMELLDKQR